MLQFLDHIKGDIMQNKKKLITNMGGVRIEASSHEELKALMAYAIKCQDNNKAEELRKLQTRGEYEN
jgi:hypothetical protein